MNYKIVSIVLGLFLAIGSTVFQREAVAVQAPTEHELALLDLINQARIDPRTAIARVGLDPDLVGENIPALRHVLDTGMDPLVFHPKLYSAAGKHTQDMFQYSQVGRVLPDGLSPMDRVLEQGYPALEVGLSAGGVVFQNFIAPENALQSIFSSMFVDELNSGDDKSLVLLNPDFSEMGITLIPGEIVLEEHTRKGYLSSCFSGHSSGMEVSSLLHEMINMVRDRPEHVLTDMNPEFILFEENAPDSENLNSGFRRMPPLAWNQALVSAGLNHVFDIEEHLYYGPVSPDGQDPFSRSYRFGYEAEKASSPLAFVEIQEGWSAGHYALELFEQLVVQEILSPDGPEHILSDGFSEIGLGVGVITLETAPGTWTSYMLLSAHLARPASPRLFVLGGVYRAQQDEAGQEHWEGIPGLKIELAELTGGVLDSSITGRTGLFQIPVISGMNRVDLFVDGVVIASKAIVMPQKNTFINFILRDIRLDVD